MWNEGKQIPVVIEVVGLLIEAFVYWCFVKSWEYRAESKMTLGMSLATLHCVVVVNKSCRCPPKTVEYVSECFAHETVRAHHAGQRGVMFTLMQKCVRLTSGRQYGDAPHSGVSRHRGDCIVTHRSQKCVYIFYMFSIQFIYKEFLFHWFELSIEKRFMVILYKGLCNSYLSLLYIIHMHTYV